MSREVVLRGLDGSSPLAFLAALGTLRLLSLCECGVRLRWCREGSWRPVLSGLSACEEIEVCRSLLDAPPMPGDLIAKLGKNLTVSPDIFGTFMGSVTEGLSFEDRRSADFAAAFGSEVCIDTKKNRIEYTKLCFITGSGHQDFVETARNLIRNTTTEHLREALFGPWRCADKGLSMRWDPSDAAEYALRWDNPGPIGVRAVWGANRLAVEALPLLPVQPTEAGLATTAFREDRYPEEFTWPLWTAPVGCDTVRALMSMAQLRENVPARQVLSAMGIAEAFRCRRVRIGQGANFKVSFRPARSV